MHTVIKAIDTDEIEFSIIMTMKKKHWRELERQLNSAWPSSKLDEAITKVLIASERQFSFTSEDK